MTVNNIIEENIILALNLDGLPNADKAKLIDKMTDVINKSVMLRVAQKLPSDAKDIFFKILDAGSDEELQNFLDTEVPDFLAIVAEETVKLKEQAVASLSK